MFLTQVGVEPSQSLSEWVRIAQLVTPRTGVDDDDDDDDDDDNDGDDNNDGDDEMPELKGTAN